MDPLLSNASNLGISGFSIWVMYKMFTRFMKHIETEHKALRDVEKEVRTTIMEQLRENTVIMSQVMTKLK